MNSRREKPSPNLPPVASRNVRQHAWETLLRADDEGTFVADLLDTSVGSLSPPDRRLAWEMTLGTLRRQATLDAVLAEFCRQPRARVEPGLWRLLQLGCYQLMYLDRIPLHAAVHETVEVGRLTGHPQWVRFANGILRGVSRALTERTAAQSSAVAYPRGDGTFREFDRPLFPDPAQDPVGHRAIVWNCPRVLLDRWQTQFGSDVVDRMLPQIDRAAPTVLRVNPLKTARDALLAELVEQGIPATAGELPESIRLEARIGPHDLTPLAAGLCSIQDETPMHAAVWLDPQPGETVLDLCAAPGTKTGHLAERMQNQGTIVATDVGSARLEQVHDNCRRLGIDIVRTQRISRDGNDIPAGPFDAILIDAPCTNTGVIGKRVEVRWRFRPEDVRELAAEQQRLLRQSAERLKPGGRLLYSTCSLEPEENQQNVADFLAARPDFERVREQLFLPGEPGDGGFLALLRRRDPNR